MQEQKTSIDLISSTISAGSIFDRSSMEVLMRCIDTLSELTNGRTNQVVQLATAIGNHLRLDAADQEELKVAVLFCDIGMWTISDDIILKKGRLSLDEINLVQKHPQYSVNALEEISLGEKTKQAILCHHEKYDGSGYPNRLSGNDIPLLAQIVNVATTLYAITAKRAYRDATSVDNAVVIIQSEVKLQFSQDIVNAVTDLDSIGEIEKIISQQTKDPFKMSPMEFEHKDTVNRTPPKKILAEFDYSDDTHLKTEDSLSSLRKMIEDDS